MMTLKQAAGALSISSPDPRIARGAVIAGGIWMRAQILKIMNEVSCDFQNEQKEVIGQFCDKIYEQLKKIDK